MKPWEQSPDHWKHAKDNANTDCPKCHGSGTFMYDKEHSTICNECCKHTLGWWELVEHYGKNNGKMCCLAGCGFVRLKEIDE